MSPALGALALDAVCVDLDETVEETLDVRPLDKVAVCVGKRLNNPTEEAAGRLEVDVDDELWEAFASVGIALVAMLAEEASGTAWVELLV